ncbi:hypothetical protein [Pseudomonas citronellolis]|uniref:hypothetical protein n=1 Tax=Pseudomonas citronellolis TaxID=53408 RepID=UPI0022BA40EC|nr:hypothetical protein [Pseudomonas citronellolis]WBG66142.1 hypothetical protein ELR50_25785 [Pseudomonas citronellolis]
MSSFYSYFKENMEALGLPAPESLYGTAATALATLSTLNTLLEKFGRNVTVTELARAGLRGERLLTMGSMLASFYIGAVIGSLAVALGRTLSGGTSLADALALASRNEVYSFDVHLVLRNNPGLYDRAMPPSARRTMIWRACA